MSIAAIAANTTRRTPPSSGSRVLVSQAYADQAHHSAPSSSTPRRRPPHVGLRERNVVTCVMAKTTTRSKKSSSGVTRRPGSVRRSPMGNDLVVRPAGYGLVVLDASSSSCGGLLATSATTSTPRAQVVLASLVVLRDPFRESVERRVRDRDLPGPQLRGSGDSGIRPPAKSTT